MPRKKTSNDETASNPAAEGENVDFEAALEELESLVERMEKGDLTLEQSLKDFERGVALTRACQQALKQAEQKVRILVDKDGEESLAPFGDED